MTKKILDTKYIRYLSALCFLVYFTSYITRINYGAIIAEIVRAEGILKSAASVITTVSFISYGAGQLISGFIGDRANPIKLIFGGLAATSVLNMLLPIVGNIYAMTAIWFLNGFAQAMIWPPLVKILSGYLSNEAFQKACVTVSIGSSVGTIAVYILSPVCISLAGWKSVFWTSGIVGLTVSLLWLRGAGKIERFAQENGQMPEASVHTPQTRGIPIKSLILPSGLIFIATGIILQGMLRDGVTTWMPSYLAETFHLGSSVSILSAVLLPVFSIFAIKSTAYLQRRFFQNELVCAGVLFFIGCIASSALAVLYAYGMVLSIILTAIITGCMHGINLILICMVPGRFECTGKVAYISGLLNFFTYVGSALSTYGIAKLSENLGWQFTIWGWAVIALAGTAVCGCCICKWKAFCRCSSPAGTAKSKVEVKI